MIKSIGKLKIKTVTISCYRSHWTKQLSPFFACSLFFPFHFQDWQHFHFGAPERSLFFHVFLWSLCSRICYQRHWKRFLCRTGAIYSLSEIEMHYCFDFWTKMTDGLLLFCCDCANVLVTRVKRTGRLQILPLESIEVLLESCMAKGFRQWMLKLFQD